MLSLIIGQKAVGLEGQGIISFESDYQILALPFEAMAKCWLTVDVLNTNLHSKPVRS